MIKVEISNNYEGLQLTVNSSIEGTPIEIMIELSMINFTVLNQICTDMGQTVDNVLPLYKIAMHEVIDSLAH